MTRVAPAGLRCAAQPSRADGAAGPGTDAKDARPGGSGSAGSASSAPSAPRGPGRSGTTRTAASSRCSSTASSNIAGGMTNAIHHTSTATRRAGRGTRNPGCAARSGDESRAALSRSARRSCVRQEKVLGKVTASRARPHPGAGGGLGHPARQLRVGAGGERRRAPAVRADQPPAHVHLFEVAQPAGQHVGRRGRPTPGRWRAAGSTTTKSANLPVSRLPTRSATPSTSAEPSVCMRRTSRGHQHGGVGVQRPHRVQARSACSRRGRRCRCRTGRRAPCRSRIPRPGSGARRRRIRSRAARSRWPARPLRSRLGGPASIISSVGCTKCPNSKSGRQRARLGVPVELRALHVDRLSAVSTKCAWLVRPWLAHDLRPPAPPSAAPDAHCTAPKTDAPRCWSAGVRVGGRRDGVRRTSRALSGSGAASSSSRIAFITRRPASAAASNCLVRYSGGCDRARHVRDAVAGS